MRQITESEAGRWLKHPELLKTLDGPEMQYVAPQLMTIYVENNGVLGVFHPAPAYGVFFSHVAVLPEHRGAQAIESAREILDFVRERFPAIETIIGMTNPENRAMRMFAVRLGFRKTGEIQTRRGPRMILEQVQ